MSARDWQRLFRSLCVSMALCLAWIIRRGTDRPCQSGLAAVERSTHARIMQPLLPGWLSPGYTTGWLEQLQFSPVGDQLGPLYRTLTIPSSNNTMHTEKGNYFMRNSGFAGKLHLYREHRGCTYASAVDSCNCLIYMKIGNSASRPLSRHSRNKSGSACADST